MYTANKVQDIRDIITELASKLDIHNANVKSINIQVHGKGISVSARVQVSKYFSNQEEN